MAACPSLSQLEKLVGDRLSDFDRVAVEQHARDCPTCRATLTTLRRPDLTVAMRSGRVGGPLPAHGVPAELADHPRYRVTGLLGSGGMGTVYRAEHRLLERPVVLKLIRRDLIDRPEQAERFRREARLAARLNHPNVVTVYEAEQLGSTQLLVMEFIDGTDLATLLALRGPLPVAEACEYARQAALGLQHVHEQGLVHRDVKPSNLMLDGAGRVKLLDLGLAMLREGDGRTHAGLTAEGQILGTVDYTAPEQWEDSRNVDIRADVYSLGCTLYHLLTGTAPFSGSPGDTLIKQMWRHANAPMPPLSGPRPDAPAYLSDVLERMLAKDPTDRYLTPGTVAEALAPFCPAPPGSASPSIAPAAPPPAAGGWRPSRRAVLGAGLGGLAGLAGLAYLFGRGRGDKPPEGEPVPPPAAGPSGPPIRVGVLHSRSGTMAVSENPVIDAVLFAVGELNRAGGVLGRPVEPVVEDGRSDPSLFAARAEKLITQDKVSVLFGCWTSASRKAVRPVVEKYGHLLFYPVQYEGLEQSPNIVYTGAAPNQQIIPAVKWCVTALKKKKFFLVGSDYVFPRAANAIIRDQADALGAEVVGEEYVTLGSTDLAGVVARLAAAGPEAILNTINGDSNLAFFRALRAAGVSAAVTPTVSFSISEEELVGLKLDQVAGDYAAWNYFQSLDRPKNHEFVARFRARYGAGRVVSDPMEAGYIGVHLWAKAVAAAGRDEPTAVRAAVGGQEFDAPEGPVRIDPATRHTAKIVRIGRIAADGRFEVVYDFEQPVTPVPFPTTRTRAEWEEFLQDLHLRWGGHWHNPGR